MWRYRASAVIVAGAARLSRSRNPRSTYPSAAQLWVFWGAPVARELHRAHDERVRPAGREPDHERVLVDPAEAREPLLRRRRDDLAAEVEQHQQVAQVGGEEGHLVGAAQQCALRPRDPL